MSEGREPGMRWVIRLAGLILGAVLGVQVASALQPSPIPIGPLRVPVFAAGIVAGGLLGALLSVWVWHRFERAMVWVLARLAHVSLRDLALGVVGLGVGLVLAFLIGVPLSRIPGVGTYLALGAAIVVAAVWTCCTGCSRNCRPCRSWMIRKMAAATSTGRW